MAIARVQAPTPGAGANATASITIAATGAGNLLIVCTSFVPSSGTPTVAITDNKAGGSQTYTPAIAPFADGNHPSYAAMSYVITAAGITSVTATWSGGGTGLACEIYVIEYSGTATGSALDQIATGQGTGTAMDSGFSPTTTNTVDLLVGFGMQTNTGAFTAGNDGRGDTYTSLQSDGHVGGFIEDFFPVSSTQTYKATGTCVGTAGWAMLHASFKAAPTGDLALEASSGHILLEGSGQLASEWHG